MSPTTGFDQFIRDMRALLGHEEESLWAQGDRLYEQRLDVEGLHKAAEILNRSVTTLRLRLKVATEFQEGTAIPRIPSVSWTIYAELMRVHDKDARMRVWTQRPPEEWTLQAMKNAVYAELPKTGPRDETVKTRTFTYERFRFEVTVRQDGSLGLQITSPIPLGEAIASSADRGTKHFVDYDSADAG